MWALHKITGFLNYISMQIRCPKGSALIRIFRILKKNASAVYKKKFKTNILPQVCIQVMQMKMEYHIQYRIYCY